MTLLLRGHPLSRLQVLHRPSLLELPLTAHYMHLSDELLYSGRSGHWPAIRAGFVSMKVASD